jgi:SNF2 family DNA or RNA helicase
MTEQIIVAPRSKGIVVPYRADLEKVIPVAKRFDYLGKPSLAMPHTDDVVKVLKNMGFQAPAPILTHYDWNDTQPFEAQRVTAAMLTTNPRAYVLNEIGTGKTRAALYAIDYLMKVGKVRKALIVAPLSTLVPVWEQEAFDHFMYLTSRVIHGTRQKRHKLLAQDADLYIINHDGVKVVEEALKARDDIDVVVIDELAVYRNHRTERWKSLERVIKDRKWVWGMTGSPTPGEPVDAWAQVRMLTPSRVPKFYKQFRDMVMYQVSQFRWLPKPEANDTVHAAMQPSVRYKRDDCLDLPPTMYETRHVELSTEQNKIYKEFMQRLRADFKEGQVTAANEGVKLSKLLQVCAGFAYGGSGKVYSIGAPERYKLLHEITEQSDHKVIVFCPFIELVTRVSDFLRKQYGAKAVGDIHGSTPKKNRDETFRAFQHGKQMRFLVAHPRTMSHGLTLTAANTIVWFSPCPSLEVYEQANGRITRPSQKNKQLIFHIESSPVERRIYKRLQDRSQLQGVLLSMFKGVQED